MIELERHIEILLLNNDCVIVPDLGGFMAHHVDARYDEENHEFLPPLRTLGFNPQLKLNDSLLAQSYVERYDISYPEALRRIEDEVAELRQHLDNCGYYELNDLGVLSLNADGRMEFEPCEAGILTPSYYGLSSFAMPTLHPATKPHKHTTTVTMPANISGANAILNQQLADDDVEETTDDERAITIKMSWVRNVVAIAAAVVAYFLMIVPVGNSEMQGEKLAGTTTTIAMINNDTNLKVARIDKQEVKKAIAERDSIVRKQAETQAASIADSEAAQTQQTAYTIVLASHVTKKNANEFVNQLHKVGLDDARVHTRNNIVRVVCGSYPTQAAAYAGMGHVRKTGLVTDAWVMKVKD